MAVSNDLLTDQRVMRHVGALREAGYEVTTVCRTDLPVRWQRGWRFYAAFNWRLWRRLRESVNVLMRECVSADAANTNAITQSRDNAMPIIVWANDTDTLPGCWLAARGRCRLVMDAHELFPEVPEIQDKPLVKWVWRTIERWLMPKCDALLTVSQGIADYYKDRYGVEMTVVRNLSSGQWSVASGQSGGSHCRVSILSTDHCPLSTLLYAGKVNVGRGVDWAIDALEWLPGCRLVVAGDGDLLEAMKAYSAEKPWADRVVFTGRLMPEEMTALVTSCGFRSTGSRSSCGVRSTGSRSPQAVGLVMLEDKGLSYHYALPNRVGAFVQAGVPMVVSDLPEMAHVVRRYGVGEVMAEPGARALAEAVERVLAREWKDEDFAAAREDMDWNKEKQKLIECVSALVRQCVREDAPTTDAITQ